MEKKTWHFQAKTRREGLYVSQSIPKIILSSEICAHSSNFFSPELLFFSIYTRGILERDLIYPRRGHQLRSLAPLLPPTQTAQALKTS